jgi:hypothetical protein
VDFKGINPVRSKIVLNNSTIGKINTLNYLGCSIRVRMHKIFRISNFLQITGMVYRILKHSKVQQHTRLEIYTKLALPALLYGCESWAVREQDKYRM